MTEWLKQSTSVTVMIGPFLDSLDGNTQETTLTITQPDIRLSKNGGAWAQKAAAQTLTHAEAGWYSVTLDATDTNTLGRLKVAIHEAGALAAWESFMVVTANIWDSLFGADLLDVSVTQWLGSAVATPGTAGVPSVDTLRVGGTVQTARDLGQGIPNAVPGAAGGLFIAGTNAATTITTGLTTTFTGNLTGSVGSVTGAVGSVTGAVGSVTGAVGSVTGAVGSVTGNVGGNVTGSVGSVAAGGITNASFAADAISAAKINADVGTEYATAILGTAVPGAFGAGTLGARIGRLPDVTAGASGGVFIAGTNAATTVTTSFTTTFTGNLTGSVASVTGAVGSVTGLTASNLDATVSSRLASASYTAPPSAATVADAVWDESMTGHFTLGSFGQAAAPLRTGTAQGGSATTITLDAGASATNQFYNGQMIHITGGTGAGQARIIVDYTGATQVADVFYAWVVNPDNTSQFAILPADFRLNTSSIAYGVWDYAVPGPHAAGTAGYVLNSAGSSGDPWGTALPGAYGAGTAGNILGNRLDATVSSRSSQTSVDTVDDFLDTEIADIQARLPAALESGRIAAALNTTNIDAILDRPVDGSMTPRQAFRVILAALAGKISGAATTTITIRSINDDKDRIIATVDADGNRSSLTLDLT